MSLIICKVCGKVYSSLTDTCPHCGNKSIDLQLESNINEKLFKTRKPINSKNYLISTNNRTIILQEKKNKKLIYIDILEIKSIVIFLSSLFKSGNVRLEFLDTFVDVKFGNANKKFRILFEEIAFESGLVLNIVENKIIQKDNINTNKFAENRNDDKYKNLEGETIDKKIKKNKNLKYVYLIITILIIGGIIGIQKYNEYQIKLESFNKLLIQFENSNIEDYPYLYNEFIIFENFEDANIYINKIDSYLKPKYQSLISVYDSKKATSETYNGFVWLDTYKDSVEYAVKVEVQLEERYTEALRVFNLADSSKNIDNIKQFESLGNYKDSKYYKDSLIQTTLTILRTLMLQNNLTISSIDYIMEILIPFRDYMDDDEYSDLYNRLYFAYDWNGVWHKEYSDLSNAVVWTDIRIDAIKMKALYLVHGITLEADLKRDGEYLIFNNSLILVNFGNGIIGVYSGNLFLASATWYGE